MWRLRLFERPVPICLLIAPIVPVLATMPAMAQLTAPPSLVWLIGVTWTIVLILLAGLTCITRNVRTSAAVIAVLLLAYVVDFSAVLATRLVPILSVVIWSAAGV